MQNKPFVKKSKSCNKMANDRTLECLYTRKNYVKKSYISETSGMGYCPLYNTVPENRPITNIRNESEYSNSNVSESTYVIILKNKHNIQKRRRKYKVLKYSKQELLSLMNSVKGSHSAVNSKNKNPYSISHIESEEARKSSHYLKKSRSFGFAVKNTVPPFYTEYVVGNVCYKCSTPECVDPYVNPAVRARLYECQLKVAQEKRACSCDSDTLFEVMKGFYECYKFKDCDNCSCILCGHLPCEHISGMGKHSTVLHNCLVYIANHGLQLPEGHTKSQKELISEVREMFAKKSKALEKFIATGTVCHSCKTPDCVNPLKNPAIRAKILECLMRPAGAKCCCACNSDVIYKVMRGLYDCYKSRDGDKCECILCGHLPCEDLGELSKSRKDLQTLDKISFRNKPEEVKDKILHCLIQIAKGGMHLPVGRSESEEELIAKAKDYLKHKSHSRLDAETQSEKAEALKNFMKSGKPLPADLKISYQKLKESKKSHVDFSHMPPEIIKEMKTRSKVMDKGVFTQLDGKTYSQKEKIIRSWKEKGVAIPGGRSKSEKKLIEKIRKESHAQTSITKSQEKATMKKISSLPESEKKIKEKLVQEEMAGLFQSFSALKGKSQEKKEKLLKAMQNQRLPLPEPRTASEKQLIEKVKKDLIKSKQKQVQEERNDLLQSFSGLKGKTVKEKEKILKDMQNQQLPLPELRTASERQLIEKMKKDRTKSKKEAKGLLQSFSGLKGKSPEEKEKILKDIQNQQLPLPEPRTASEKQLIEKMKKDQTKSKKEAKGLLQSYSGLKGKSPEEKNKILKDMQNAQLPLPEPKTASDKKLIEKIKKDQLKSFTNLKGMSQKEKEKLLKSAAKALIPLPEPKTQSEKKIIKTILQQQLSSTFSSIKDKTPSEKERVLKTMAKQNVSLPETKSEKKLAQKIQKEKPPPTFEDLKVKTPKDKEKILKAIANQNLPLPEPRSQSERKLIEKVQKKTSPPLLSVLKDKTPEEKQKILKSIAGHHLPLPKPRSQSEEKLLKKILKETPSPTLSKLKHKLPEERDQIIKQYVKPIAKTPSEKALVSKILNEIPKAKTPSEKALVDKILKEIEPPTFETIQDRTPAEKEMILKSMAKHNVPLPTPKSASEKNLIEKLQKEMLPPSLLDLKDKPREEIEKLMRNLAKKNLPLPEPKTSSDKKIYDKVTKKMTPRSFSDLKGKSLEEKKYILKNIANQGQPLPKPKTESQKKLIDEIQKQTQPPPSKLLRDLTTSREMKLVKEDAKALDEALHGKLSGEPKTIKGKGKKLGKEEKPKVTGKTKLKSDVSAMKRTKAQQHLALPEPKTSSEKNLIDKLLKEVPLPHEGGKRTKEEKFGKTKPGVQKIKTASEEINKHNLSLTKPKSLSERKLNEKLIKTSLPRSFSAFKDKTAAEKENTLKIMANQHLPLPEPKTNSEKKLVQKILLETPPPTLSELKHKRPKDRYKILQDYAKYQIPLPKAKTPSEKALVDKIILGMPPPTFESLKEKTPSEKERILKLMLNQNIPLPEPKTKSEKRLIQNIQLKMPPITFQDLKGKSSADKENILFSIANKNLPLPEPRSPSEKKILDKVLLETLPRSFSKLKGKTPEEKERILKIIAHQHLPLPEPKSQSEKKLVQKILLEIPPPPLSELKHKPPEESDKILEYYIKYNIPLPKAKTPSEKALVDRFFIQMPPSTFAALKDRKPSEKERILKIMLNQNVPLPEPKTKSERKLVQKIKLEMPPQTFQELERKTPEDKETIFISIGNQNIPLSEPRSPSEKKVFDKVLKDIRPHLFAALKDRTPEEKERILKIIAHQHLPLPEPKTQSEKKLVQKILLEIPPTPLSELKHKPPEESDKILEYYIKYNIPLPKAKTPSEKALLDRIFIQMPPSTFAALKEKKPSEKERILKIMLNQNVPLPEPKTISENKIIQKIQLEMPPQTFQDLKEKTPEDKETIFISIGNQNIPLSEPRSPSEKKVFDKVLNDIRPHLFAALKDRTPEEKERILKIIAHQHLPLPEPKSQSEKKLVHKILLEIPPPPLSELKHKTPEESDKILKDYVKYNIPLPKAKTPSEKALVNRIFKQMPPSTFAVLKDRKPSEKERILKIMLNQNVPLPEPKKKSEKKIIQKIHLEIPPLTFQDLMGKTPEDKEKILISIANQNLPLPEPRSPSERKLLDKVLTNTRPRSFAALKDKTPEEKEKLLKSIAERYLPLPVPKSQSEKKLVQKILKEIPPPTFRQLKRNAPDDQEQILKEYVKHHIPLPVAKTLSEKSLMEKILKEMQTPNFEVLKGKSFKDKEKLLKAIANQYSPLPEPRSLSERKVYEKVLKEIRPHSFSALKDKTEKEKEKVLKYLAEQHLPLPEPKTQSEKKLVQKILKETPAPNFSEIKHKPTKEKEKIYKDYAKYHTPLPKAKTPSEKALLDKIFKGMPPPDFGTLKDKTASEKEKILKIMAKRNVPLPEPKTISEKKLVQKIQAEMPPTTFRDLKGKTSEEKEKILKAIANQYSPLPKPRSPSEVKLIEKILKETRPRSFSALKEKTPEEKENVLKNIAKQHLLLPEAKSHSEKKLVQKILNETPPPTFSELKQKLPEERKEILQEYAKYNIPLPEAKTLSEKAFLNKILNEIPPPSFGILKDKTASEKEKFFKTMAKQNITLPKPKTISEKKLIQKIQAEKRPTTFQDLKGKTSEEKENILKAIVNQNLPLPEPRSPSERKLLEIVLKETRPYSFSALNGKTLEEKEKILKSIADRYLPLPEAKTQSEKKLVLKILKETPSPTFSKLKYKLPEEKEKIFKEYAKYNIPLPKAKTISEKALLDRIFKKMPPPTFETLKDRTPSDKEGILRTMAKHNINLPIPKSVSEKKLVEKLQKEITSPTFSDLKEKTSSEIEKIMRNLARQNFILPEPKTMSERKIYDKVMKEMAPRSFSDLKDKSPKEKEKILKSIAAHGGILPKPKTESQKSINEKIQKYILNDKKTKGIDEAKLISGTVSEQEFKEKVKKEIAVPSFTALQNKSNKEKEDIIKKIAKKHFILPIPQTDSEKQLLEKIKKELPRPSFTSLKDKTASEKELYIKAMARQKLPLPQPETTSQKQLLEKILQTSDKSAMKRTMAQQHLPLPEPKTSSEKKMIDKLLKEERKTIQGGKLIGSKRAVTKIKAASDIDAARKLKASPKLRTSEIVRKKTTKVGASKSEPAGRSEQARKYAKKKISSLKGFAAQEIQEITTKTKCDRACGCDMKKIRFKDSYIKIHVVSPDLSSLCPCPEDPPCFSTGIASGVVVNDDGIAVTIGVALGAPLCTYESIWYKSRSSLIQKSYEEQSSSRYFKEIFQPNNNSICITNKICDGINGAKIRECVSCTVICRSSLHYLNYSELSTKSSPKSLNIKKSESLDSLSIPPLNSGIQIVSVNSALETTTSTSSYEYDNCKHDYLENSDHSEYQTSSLQSKSKSNIRAIKNSDLDVNSTRDSCITLMDNKKITVLKLFNFKQKVTDNNEIKIDALNDSATKNYYKEVLQVFDRTYRISDKTNESGNSDITVKKSSSKNETSVKVREFSAKSLDNSNKACSEKVLAINSFRHCLERVSVSSNNFEIDNKENEIKISLEMSENKEFNKKKEISDPKPVVGVDSTEDFTKIVNDFLLNEIISDTSSILLLIPFDDQNSEDSTLSTSQMLLQLCRRFSDQRFLNNNMVDMVNNSTQAGQAHNFTNTYQAQSKHKGFYQEATSTENAYNSPMLYSTFRSHRNSRRQVTRNQGSFKPGSFYEVESGYTHPLHQDLRKGYDYDTYETSHHPRRVRPNPPGLTFTRLPKDAKARVKVPERESPEWEKEPWRDQWRRQHRKEPSYSAFDRVYTSRNPIKSPDENPDQMFDEAGRLVCSGCVSRSRQSQQAPSIADGNALDSSPDKKKSKYFLTSIFRGTKSKSVTILQDSFTSTHSYMVFGRDQGTLCYPDKKESNSKFFTSMFRGRKVWGAKSASNLQDSFTSTHSYMVFGHDQGTLCQVSEFDNAERGTCQTKEPVLRIALSPSAETSGTGRHSQEMWRGIYEDLIKLDQNVPTSPQSETYRNQVDFDYNQTPSLRQEDDSLRFYRDLDIEPQELLGYWESSSDSGLIPYPHTMIFDCSSSGSGLCSVTQHRQTDTTVDRPCGCVVERKPCDKVTKDEDGTKVEPGCGSVLLLESGCHKKYKCSSKNDLEYDIAIDCSKRTVQQVVKEKAHECAKPPAPRKKKEQPPPKPKWKPQMVVYGGEQIKLETRRKMRHPDECCDSHKDIYKNFPSCQSLYHTPSTSKSAIGCKAKEFMKLSNVTPVDPYGRTRPRKKAPGVEGCWNARSPTGSRRHLRRVGMVRECEPKSPWTSGCTHEASCSCDEGSLQLPYKGKRVQMGALKPPISKRRSAPRRGYVMKMNSIISQTISGFEMMMGKDVVRYQQNKFYEECLSCVCDKKRKWIDVKKIYSRLVPKPTVECQCEPESDGLRVGGKGIKMQIEAKGTAEMPQAIVSLGSSLRQLCSAVCVEGGGVKRQTSQDASFTEKLIQSSKNSSQ